MVLDMAPMLRGEIKYMPFSYTLETEAPDGVCFPSGAAVNGEITNNGYMEMHLTCEVPYRTECARCLAPVEGVFRIEMERLIAAPESLSREQIEENVDKYLLLEGTELHPDDEVHDELIMCFPTKVLCAEDCPGLCPRCGKPRREGACGCPERDPDPRWDVLAHYFDDKQDDVSEDRKDDGDDA